MVNDTEEASAEGKTYIRALAASSNRKEESIAHPSLGANTKGWGPLVSVGWYCRLPVGTGNWQW